MGVRAEPTITMGSCTAIHTSSNLLLTRSHAQRPVEPNDFPIQHGVFADVLDQGRIFSGTAQSRRKRDILAEGLPNLRSEPSHHGSLKNPGRDGDDPNTEARKLAGDWQGKRRDTTLRSSVGGLTYLAVESGDRSRVDDYAALSVLTRRFFGDGFSGQADHVERSHKIDADGS